MSEAINELPLITDSLQFEGDICEELSNGKEKEEEEE